MASRIQLRNGTAALWAERNPVLARGEPGLEYDTGLMKVGDGETAWNDLPYAYSSGQGETAATTTFVSTGLDYTDASDVQEALEDHDAAIGQVASDLSGHAEATTAVHGIDDTSDLATQTDVANAVGDVVGDAPSTLDTLGKLADAIGEDATFATTVTGLISGVASDLTDHETDSDDAHPASAISVDSGSLAHTNATDVQAALADLDAAISAGQTVVPVSDTSYTPTAADAGKIILLTADSLVTVTINGSLDLPKGKRIEFVQYGDGPVIFVDDSATLNAFPSKTITGRYGGVALYAVDTDEYLLIGALAEAEGS